MRRLFLISFCVIAALAFGFFGKRALREVLVYLLVSRGQARLDAENRKPAPSFKDAIGVPLPATATNLQALQRTSIDCVDYYAAADIDESSFLSLMRDLRMRQASPKASYYSGAMPTDTDVAPWWSTVETPGEQLWFDAHEGGYIVAKHENGRMYVHRYRE
jgi:hypothetical protein